MCLSIVLDGKRIQSAGELRDAIGREPVWDSDDMWPGCHPKDDECLCALDLRATARLIGRIAISDDAAEWHLVEPFPIKWEGEPRHEHEDFLRYDLIETLSLEPVDDLSGLVFHTCLLTDDFDGPTISCGYDPDTGGITAEYHAKTTWMPMDGEG